MNLDSRLSALEARGLIRSVGQPGEGEFLFRHTLFQETAYRSLLRGERTELHRSVAGILEKLHVDDEDSVAPILAYHFKQAGDEQRALRYFTLAAKAAAKVYANQEAIEHYQQAIDLALRVAPEPDRLVELYTGCGRLHELMGDFDGAIRVYDVMQAKSRALNLPILEVKARVARDTLYSSPSAVNDTRKAMQSGQATLAMARELGDEEAEAHSLWNLMLAGFFSGQGKVSREYGEQALTLAQRIGDRQLEAFIMNDLARSNLFSDGLQARGFELAESAVQLWKELDNIPMLTDGLSGLAMFASYSGDYRKAVELSEQALAMSEEIDHPWGKAYSQYVMSMAYMEMGDYMQTMRTGDEALRWSEVAGFVVPQVAIRALQAWVLKDLGRPDEAEEIARVATECAKTSLPMWTAMGLAMEVLLDLSRSEPPGSGRFGELLDLLSDPERQVFPVAEIYGRFAEASYFLATGEYKSVLDTTERITSLQTRLNSTSFKVDSLMVRGRAARSLGMVEDGWSALEGARDLAEKTGAGRTLWRVLHLMRQWAAEDGRPEAAELKALARKALGPVVEPLKDEWRGTFLATPDAAEVWSA